MTRAAIALRRSAVKADFTDSINNGRVAKAGSTVQTNATSKNPSRGCNSRREVRVANQTNAPATNVINTAAS